MSGKIALPEKYLLRKSAALKGFEYLTLGKELKNHISVAKKQFKDFDKVFNYDEN